MTEVISIRFKSGGKQYFFDPRDTAVEPGSKVIIETSKGLELGECMKGNHQVPNETIVPPLKPLIRIATEEDLEISRCNKAKEADAFRICQEKIQAHNIDMKLVSVEYNFEGSKIIFFFTADGRVDFRELVKDLASVFRTRIELRQIGVRDEAKMIGGLGVCGRPFCCNQFLDDFQPVSTKMAKTQSMSLNPAKISGSCGRLMCCLRYEQEAYEDLLSKSPKPGTFVETPAGFGNVTHVSLLRQKVKVKIDGSLEDEIKSYDSDEIAVVAGGRPKDGAKPQSVLKKSPPKLEIKEQLLTSRRILSTINPAAPEPKPGTAGRKAPHRISTEQSGKAAPPKNKPSGRSRSNQKGSFQPPAKGAKPETAAVDGKQKTGYRKRPRRRYNKNSDSSGAKSE